MLISKIDSDSPQKENHSHEYQTADELFEFMSNNHNFDNSGEDLTTRDLVILYKNIDKGTKLMSDATDLNKIRRPNQLVETIVHEEDADSGCSEIGDIYSTEDVNNVIAINKERIDMLNYQSSYENNLCHKLGDLEIQNSQFGIDYDKYFLFRDPYVKHQLKNLNQISSGIDCGYPVLPATLLDYICCKRLEDNYNFYMDNIICYVKHTIEQLKRISNGDYLTDRAKEKWREVENIENDQNTKVLATSTSIPLHVEKKTSSLKSTWDDIVRSEIDVRSLSKILEKKLVLEVPKLICGTYKLFSKRYADNLIITCKREKTKSVEEDLESRVDVVLQLQRSEAGQVISKISSIMILQSSSAAQQEIISPIPLPSIELPKESVCYENKVKIIEIDKSDANDIEDLVTKDTYDKESIHEDSAFDSTEFTCSENKGNISSTNQSNQESNESSEALSRVYDKKEVMITMALNVKSPDELENTIQKLNMQTLPEESGEDGVSLIFNPPTSKKKSPTRVRIKSPYENKSHVLDEKKRKKLLEIRVRRERRKLAMGERCKNKYYGKSASMPQSTNSVTKLSITNKSFYNSIYGQNVVVDSKSFKGKFKKLENDTIPEISINGTEAEYEQYLETPDKNNIKYVNKSYYLDEAETEMMLLSSKRANTDKPQASLSASTSAVSSDFKDNLTLLSQLLCSTDTETESNNDVKFMLPKDQLSTEEKIIEKDEETNSTDNLAVRRSSCVVIADTGIKKKQLHDKKHPKMTSSALECRESIDQIYELLKQNKKGDASDAKLNKSDLIHPKTENIVVVEARSSSTIQNSDSGTSFKHYQNCAISSDISSNKINIGSTKQVLSPNRKLECSAPVISKAFTSTKLPTPIVEKVKKEKKVVINAPVKLTENPLKAISQLLHQFENVQQRKEKIKENKIQKMEMKNVSCKNSFQPRSGIANTNMEVDRLNKITPRQRNSRVPVTDISKIPQRQITVEGKRGIFRKKLDDFIDQAKEARGEAVRGPPKFPSRLNTLAQPKRPFSQALNKEYHNKNERNLITNRLQRLANSPPRQRPTGPPSSQTKMKGSEAISSAFAKHSRSVPPLERTTTRYSVTNNNKQATSPADTLSFKNNIPSSPGKMKKMMTVESNVNTHHGRVAAGNLSHHQQISRVPILPNDILASDLSSNPEESSELGNQLHHIINSLVNANTSTLAVVSEGLETSFKFTRSSTDNLLEDSLSKEDEHFSNESDYQIDILQDRNVETVVNTVQNMVIKKEIIVNERDTVKSNTEPFTSSTELHKLENALFSRIPVGAFQKRLRIKNFTLTPKHSMRQLFALQSGDIGSPFINVIPQNRKLNKVESLCELKSVSVLSNTNLSLTLTGIPMQITTVGYSFPSCGIKFDTDRCITSSKRISLIDVTQSKIKNKSSCLTTSKSDDIKLSSKDCAKNGTDQVDKSYDLNDDIQTAKGGKSQENKSVEISSDDFKIVASILSDQNKEQKDNATYVNLYEHVDDVDHSTSLDMLVGLLNEIQKITSCQSQIANVDVENPKGIKLQTTLSNDAEIEVNTSNFDEPTRDALMEKLKPVESGTRIYTYYISKNDTTSEDVFNSSVVINEVEDNEPLRVDKEVSVNTLDKEYVTNSNNVPSQFFSITLDNSTNVTNSLIGVLSQPSSHSVFSVGEYEIFSSIDSNKTLALPKRSENLYLTLTPHNENGEKKMERNEKSCIEIFSSVGVCRKIHSQRRILNNSVNVVKKCKEEEEFDSILKMKRDILVTFYLILVFTVFTALSFPEILYNF